MAERCSKHKMYYQPCSICAEIAKLEADVLDRNNKTIELEAELDEVSSELEKAINANLKPERMNPSIRNRLFVQDLNNVRGFLLSYTFLHNTIVQGKDRLEQLSGVEFKQWTLFIKEIEEVYERWVDLKNLLINDMSNSNWNRMIKEVQAITQKIVTQVNHRNLGHWTLSEEGTVDVEYKIRPLVVKAIETCIHSAGTNSLTAYSKEELIKSIVKIVEEK